MSELAPHLRSILELPIPRFSRAEMGRRRAAIEALLAAHDCDHLVFCGANRVGSAVQWLTQWPVTAEAVGVMTPGERDALFVQYVNHVPQARLIADEADVSWGGESSIAAAIATIFACVRSNPSRSATGCASAHIFPTAACRRSGPRSDPA